MIPSRLELDTTAINAAISTCEKRGEWEQSLHFFSAMAQSEVALDTIIFNTGISVCEKTSKCERGICTNKNRHLVSSHAMLQDKITGSLGDPGNSWDERASPEGPEGPYMALKCLIGPSRALEGPQGPWKALKGATSLNL